MGWFYLAHAIEGRRGLGPGAEAERPCVLATFINVWAAYVIALLLLPLSQAITRHTHGSYEQRVNQEAELYTKWVDRGLITLDNNRGALINVLSKSHTIILVEIALKKNAPKIPCYHRSGKCPPKKCAQNSIPIFFSP